MPYARTFVAVAAAAAVLGAGCSKKTDTQTPPAAQAPAETPVRVSEVKTGIAVGADKRVTDEVDVFKPTETVYVSVVTEGTAPSAELKARWTFGDGQVVDEKTQMLSPAGRAITEFHVSKPDGWPRGNYRVEVFLNGAPAGSEDFQVG
jgi:hypothetical protein